MANVRPRCDISRQASPGALYWAAEPSDPSAWAVYWQLLTAAWRICALRANGRRRGHTWETGGPEPVSANTQLSLREHLKLSLQLRELRPPDPVFVVPAEEAGPDQRWSEGGALRNARGKSGPSGND